MNGMNHALTAVRLSGKLSNMRWTEKDSFSVGACAVDFLLAQITSNLMLLNECMPKKSCISLRHSCVCELTTAE